MKYEKRPEIVDVFMWSRAEDWDDLPPWLAEIKYQTNKDIWTNSRGSLCIEINGTVTYVVATGMYIVNHGDKFEVISPMELHKKYKKVE